MPTAKKTSSRRPAMRDIAINKPKEEDSFTVHRVQPRVETRVEPLRDNSYDQFNQSQELEDAIEEAMPSNDFLNQADDLDDQGPMLSTIEQDSEPKDFVRVKFSKFVQLIASHDFDEVVKNSGEEDIVLSSNLLTELAGTHDEREEKKVPIVFLIGLAIGVVLTYILLTK